MIIFAQLYAFMQNLDNLNLIFKKSKIFSSTKTRKQHLLSYLLFVTL